MAKNRVSPVKKITLPRLELMAAVIGARLVQHIQKTIQHTNVVLWSDSQIDLYWINTTKPQNRFVENRIKEIKELTGGYQWKYCPTHSNPADLQTRGIERQIISENTLWMKGPEWLCDKSSWPSWTPQTLATLVTSTEEPIQDVQRTILSHNVTGIHRIINFAAFSKYQRLLRVTAYVIRFMSNIKPQKNCRQIGHLTVDELHNAELLLLRSCQMTSYPDEIFKMTGENIGTCQSSIVRKLRLFMDTDKLLYCGGRIHNAPIAEITRFPVLLPTDHNLTRLIVQNAHERVLHSGENATITVLRQRFWIPRIRQCVKSTLRKCTVCRKVTGRCYAAPESPPLTSYRVEESHPFTVTGVDFTVALYVKGKDGTESKAYICLFTCAATRAIHIEVVSNLTEEAFLQAFRKFTSRKSLPRLMVSDNAMTFQAAANHLRRLTSSQSVHEQLNTKGTQWQFIPKRAPWFGGWWERLIGLTKTSLKKTLGRTYITIEELQTVATEIECILNDRPITFVSSNSDDPTALTPAQLLYGRNITNLPYQHCVQPAGVKADHASLNRRAEKQRKLINHFLERWKTEYLTSLREHQQTRHRTNNKEIIHVGDVVQIHDEKPRTDWKLGVITELVRGKDGYTRSAQVRTQHGMTNRPVSKLYPLEVVNK